MSSPRPGSQPRRLGREEGIEDPVADLGGNAGPVVGDPDDDRARLRGRPRPRLGPTPGRRRARCRSGSPRSGSARRRTRGRAGDPAPRWTDTATDFPRAFDFRTATVFPRPWARSTGPAAVAWSMCVKPLTASTSPAIRVAASWISDARRRTEHPAAAQRSAALSAGPSTAPASRSSASIVTAVSASASAAAVSRPWSASQSAMASSRSACSIGDRTPCSGAAAHALRTPSIASNWASVRPAAPSARAGLLDVLERGSPRSAALRSIADAGLFSSWARPAERRPSEIIFSSCSSLDVNSRARSIIRWTRIDVSPWHSRVERGACAPGARRRPPRAPGRSTCPAPRRGGSTEADPSRRRPAIPRTSADRSRDR